MGESRFRARTSSVLRFVFGSGLVLLSGLEYARMLLPYDPWYDEAKRWRQWAVKNGYRPTWWYGAIGHYTPMLMEEWKTKTSTWINNTANALEAPPASDGDVLQNITIGPHSALKAGESGTYHDIYSNLYNINAKRTRELLSGELAQVNELNKAARLDAVLEGKVQLNEDYVKPNIQLGSHTMETDDEFDMIWANFEPWDEMGQETDFDIRLIPRWRCVDDVEEGYSIGENEH